MRKFYFSFGQSHRHEVNGQVFDKDCLVQIDSETYMTARRKMFEVFGDKWHRQYNESSLEEILGYYPRGVMSLEDQQ